MEVKIQGFSQSFWDFCGQLCFQFVKEGLAFQLGAHKKVAGLFIVALA